MIINNNNNNNNNKNNNNNFIHAACTFIIKETPACSCFPVSSAEFLRIHFF